MASLPQYWSLAADGAGRTVLTYAVRGGKAAPLLSTLGVICLLAGLWGIQWLLVGGGITIAGLIFAIVVPGGLAVFGAHCLNIVLLARDEYALGSHGLIARAHSLWGSGKATEIPRAAVTGIVQRYTPPGPSSPSGAPGTWTTFVAWQGKDGKEGEFALAGLGSPAEARWLGPLLAKWAGVPLRRGHGGGFEEADAAELPSLDA